VPYAYEDPVAVESHGVAVQARACGVHPVTRPRVEHPLVCSTGEDAITKDALGKRVRQVGAPVLVGEHLPVEVAQQDVDGSEVTARISPCQMSSSIPAYSHAATALSASLDREDVAMSEPCLGDGRGGIEDVADLVAHRERSVPLGRRATSWSAKCATVRSFGVTTTRPQKSSLG
jgi:hypothetical protein